MKCIVCGYRYGSQTTKLTLFKVPSESTLFENWQRQCPVDLHPKSRICEKHFNPDDIVKEKIFKNSDGIILATAKYDRPHLKPNAVPRFITKSDPPKRSLAEDETSLEPPHKRPSVSPIMPVDLDQSENISFQERIQESVQTLSLPSSWFPVINTPSALIYSNFILNTSGNSTNAVPFKQVCIIGNKITATVSGQDIDANLLAPENVENLHQVELLIRRLDSSPVCIGLSLVPGFNVGNIACKDHAGNVRHKHCSIILPTENELMMCSKCTRLKKTLQQKKRRRITYLARNKTTSILRGERYQNRNMSGSCQQAISSLLRSRRLKQRHLKKLRIELSSCQNNLKVLNEELLETTLDTHSSSLPKNTLSSVREIIAASKLSNSRGRRYSDEWIILSLLFHIRSPKGYNFIRANNILPLPSYRTVRRYLSMINTKCGFDENFLKMFEKQMMQKEEYARHGILSVDEIVVRENVAVNANNLSYVGLSDFGTEKSGGQSLDEKANHGLVFMFEPLADDYSQPVAVFASHGSVNGTELAKLLIKSIILLERSGAYIHGTVADGAKTNRKAWKMLGVSGKRSNFQNSFSHPVDENRRIFVFSDTPHILKCIRNLLYANDFQVSPDEPLIKWHHFVLLHQLDSQLPAYARVCPNLTRNHIELSTSGKMRVWLAAQIFSESTVAGLKLYSSQGLLGIENVQGTIDFCKQINDMFDALNRKLPKDGLVPGSNDSKVLLGSVSWLDRWEDNHMEGKLNGNFLSASTAEGLRVTLYSTLELCDYMCDKYNFKYLLTGKINQDSLEKFFGIIRQAGGQNDHPTMPTFLQLYKLLSVYSVLKPPKYGNCTVTQGNPPSLLVNLQDLREIFQPENNFRATQVENLRLQLDGLIQTSDWEADDVIQVDDVSFAPAIDCVIYYVSGYVIKQLCKCINCDLCKNFLLEKNTTYSRSPVAQLTNLKTHGGLIHPNLNIFNLLKDLEKTFAQFARMQDAYEKTVNSFLSTFQFSFPCELHKESVVATLVNYYLSVRLRQFTRQENRECLRQSESRKKEAKFFLN